MERIKAFSVEVIQKEGTRQLSYGGTYYGPIGKLIGSVMDNENNCYLIFKKPNESYFMKQALIDTSVFISKNGPFISEAIIVEEYLKEVSREVLLNLLENGKFDVSLGLQQHNNAVFIAKEEVFEELKELKKQTPNDSLNTCLKMQSKEKTLVKKQKA